MAGSKLKLRGGRSCPEPLVPAVLGPSLLRGPWFQRLIRLSRGLRCPRSVSAHEPSGPRDSEAGAEQLSPHHLASCFERSHAGLPMLLEEQTLGVRRKHADTKPFLSPVPHAQPRPGLSSQVPQSACGGCGGCGRHPQPASGFLQAERPGSQPGRVPSTPFVCSSESHLW